MLTSLFKEQPMDTGIKYNPVKLEFRRTTRSPNLENKSSGKTMHYDKFPVGTDPLLG
jgi:hypothetical protein